MEAWVRLLEQTHTLVRMLSRVSMGFLWELWFPPTSQKLGQLANLGNCL